MGYFHRFGIRLALRRNLNAIREAVRECPANLARLSSYLGYLKHSDNAKTYRALAGILSYRVSTVSNGGIPKPFSSAAFTLSETLVVFAALATFTAVALLLVFGRIGTFSNPPVSFGCPVEPVIQTVNGASMEPLVPNGTELTLLLGYYRCQAPKKGDFVAYGYAGRKNPLAKVVRATDADVLAWGQSGTLLVNGEILSNSVGTPYVFSSNETRLLSQYVSNGKIPEGSVLIFGDSVSASVDSRNFGAVGRGDLLGKFVFGENFP